MGVYGYRLDLLACCLLGLWVLAVGLAGPLVSGLVSALDLSHFVRHAVTP